ncbi:MAG: ribbon-helix-helix domain-containing protein [Alphaproteobacteria bacterium]
MAFGKRAMDADLGQGGSNRGRDGKQALRGTSTLVNRNVFVGDRRTSLRLEPAMWDALAEISRREDVTLHQLCALIDERRQASSLTAAIRVFIVAYFRSAATEEGHASIGHGALYGVRMRDRGAAAARRAARVPARTLL